MYPTTAAMPKTVLRRITDELFARIDAMQNEDASRLWNLVTLGSVQDINGLPIPAVGLVQGPEQTTQDLYPYKEKVVTLYAEFRFEQILNVDSLATFQYYLGKLQARLFGAKDNIILGGLATNVIETGSNPEIEGQNDSAPGGLLMFQVYYRHWTADPYHLLSETPQYEYGSI